MSVDIISGFILMIFHASQGLSSCFIFMNAFARLYGSFINLCILSFITHGTCLNMFISLLPVTLEALLCVTCRDGLPYIVSCTFTSII
jgi:hypothetical protein